MEKDIKAPLRAFVLHIAKAINRGCRPGRQKQQGKKSCKSIEFKIQSQGHKTWQLKSYRLTAAAKPGHGHTNQTESSKCQIDRT